MNNLFYTIIIYPLYQIIEIVFRAIFEIFKIPGFSIIGVSAAVSIMCLPLYAIAEKWQTIERNTQKKLKPGIDRIKATFKGDEQYMILNTFYHQNHYHPLMSLRSSIGLLIQIPFFIAAYSFLSSCPEIQRCSFLWIENLANPDALLKIGAFQINVLPLLMTAINIFAGIIYTKGFSLREKLQIHIMAIVFLIILYQSPSGLVLYWTMNNVFSLIKNIFYKLKNPLKVLWISSAIILFFASVYVLFNMKPRQSLPLFAFTAFIAFLPVIIKYTNLALNTVLQNVMEDKKLRFSLFIFSAFGFVLLTGFVIPSLLITASTSSDFFYIDDYKSPVIFLLNSTAQSFGFFLLWPLIIYILFDKKIQTLLSVFFTAGLCFSIINAFCFQGDYGNISADLIFTEHKEIHPTLFAALLNFSVLFAVTAIFIILFIKKKIFIFNWINYISVISLAGITILNFFIISAAFKKATPPDLQKSKIKPIFKLSKTHKNVLILMLDKAPGYLLDYCLKECPEMMDSFKGFTFYPNTVSFGSWTIQGAPGLYGGYEYTPWEMNHRREISMKDKHNESLSLLPLIFEANGYDSYLIDPPYPNYDERPVFSFLNGYDKIFPVEAMKKYSDLWYSENNFKKIPVKSNRIKRNFLWFSIFKIVPMSFRAAVHYNDWWTAIDVPGWTADFIDRYSVLDYLPKLTEITDDDGKFVFIDNEAIHDPGFVLPPDYRPVDSKISTELFKVSPLSEDPAFHAMTGSLKCICTWLDYLKENGIYDNTRIIIASDHGSYHSFTNSKSLPRNIEWFNPLLMVKDFNEEKEFQINNEFMTQADVPAIAIEDVIDEAINPFTGNKISKISQTEKQKKTIISFGKANRVLATENNGFIISDNEWFTVKDNVLDISNWSKLNVKNGEFVK